jgi:hypothetical protein
LQATFGVDMAASAWAGRCPDPVPTRLVLEVLGGPCPAVVAGRAFDARVSFYAVGKKSKGALLIVAELAGCNALARAAVGHDRVGLRRLDAATVALVVERPPQVGTPCLAGSILQPMRPPGARMMPRQLRFAGQRYGWQDPRFRT